MRKGGGKISTAGMPRSLKGGEEGGERRERVSKKEEKKEGKKTRQA